MATGDSNANYRHGHAVGKQSLTYRTWYGIITRCKNPKNPAWEDYGGRGITVCERWDNFINFLEDMGEKPSGMSLDRIDNNKGYSPKNCRWVNWGTQCSNRRSNVWVTVGGEKMTVKQASDKLNIPATTIYSRLKRRAADQQTATLIELQGWVRSLPR